MGQAGQTAQALRDAEDQIRDIGARLRGIEREMQDALGAIYRIRRSVETGPELEPPRPDLAKIAQGDAPTGHGWGAAGKAAEHLASGEGGPPGENDVPPEAA
jgi:hypothetical protein